MMSKLVVWRSIRKSASTFPITALYVFGVLIILLMQHEVIGVRMGVALLSLTAILLLLLSITKELRAVHILVNGRHEALVKRINQLMTAMNKADVDVPDDPNRPKGGPTS